MDGQTVCGPDGSGLPSESTGDAPVICQGETQGDTDGNKVDLLAALLLSSVSTKRIGGKKKCSSEVSFVRVSVHLKQELMGMKMQC